MNTISPSRWIIPNISGFSFAKVPRPASTTAPLGSLYASQLNILVVFGVPVSLHALLIPWLCWNSSQ